MPNQKRKNNENKKRTQAIMLFIFPLLLFIVLISAASLVSVSIDLQKETTFAVLLSVTGACSLISGFISGKCQRQQGIIIGIIYVLPTLTLLIVISLILNSFSFDINIIIASLISLISASVGGITGVNVRQKAKRIKK